MHLAESKSQSLGSFVWRHYFKLLRYVSDILWKILTFVSTLNVHLKKEILVF